ncbi:MAG TPA: beta-aspartyl-peptidase, partial [Myxococcota bacterium]|nr:beta-aspartyl-peptidase [Myxococcota bacterium]
MELVVLRGAELFDPAPRGAQDVLVAGGRVAAIAPSLGEGPPGWPVEVVDCAGLRLVPGLIDAHTHMTGGGGEGGARTRVPAVGLSRFTLAGVTTAVGLLGTDCTTRSIAENLACARGLAELGLHALCYTGGYQVPPVTVTGSVRGDLVHVDRVVAVGEVAISDHRSSQPTFDELVRIASDAHVAGMMTGKAGLLHLHMGDGERGLALVRRALDETELPPRTFHPTHCNRNRRLWAEAMELGRRGGFVDVTGFPDDDSAAEDIAAWLAAGLDPSRITLSSDGGGCLPTFDADGVLLHMDVGRSHTLLQAVFAAVDRADRPFDADPQTAARRRDLQSRRESVERELNSLDAET